MEYEKQNQLSSNLIALRHAYGYKQEDVAQILHISRTTYAQYESSSRLPSTEMLYDLSQIFHVNIDSMINMSISDVYTEMKYFQGSIGEIRSLVDAYKKMSNYSRGCLMERVDILLQRDNLLKGHQL